MTFFEELASNSQSRLPLKISSLLLLCVLPKLARAKLLVVESKEEKE